MTHDTEYGRDLGALVPKCEWDTEAANGHGDVNVQSPLTHHTTLFWSSVWEVSPTFV